MRRSAWVLLLVAALLSACGGSSPAATAPTTVPAEPATAISATAIPAATATVAATSAPTSEPTAQLYLQPSAEPTAAPQLSATEPAANASIQVAAQPSPAPQRAPAPAAGPVRLVIGDIKLDYRPVSVGLDKNLIPVVPEHDVGWYNLSSGPGEGENIVLWGHVLRFRSAPKIPAPFARVKELAPGASLVLYDGTGNKHSYVVKQQIWVRPDQVEYILPQGKEMVTLVSCIGDKVISNGEVVDESHRLITIAEPAG